MELHTELDSSIKGVLRIIGGVDISELPRLHEAAVVVDHSCDDTISDGLGNDLLGLIDALEGELLLDVAQGDLRVRNVELLQTELEDCMLEPLNKRVSLILFEKFFIFIDDSLEGIHITRFDTIDNLEVWLKRSLQELLQENLSVWNLTHKKLNYNL